MVVVDVAAADSAADDVARRAETSEVIDLPPPVLSTTRVSKPCIFSAIAFLWTTVVSSEPFEKAAREAKVNKSGKDSVEFGQ